MNLDALTVANFNPLFRRLMVAYQHRIPDAWLDESIRTYFRLVRKFDAVVVEQAVDALIADPTAKYFPKANQLYAVCRRLLGERQAIHDRQHHVERDSCVCEDCQSAFTWRTYYVATFGPARAKFAIDFERTDGTMIPVLGITKLLCDCRWRRILDVRTDDELRALAADPDSEPAPLVAPAMAGVAASNGDLHDKKSAWRHVAEKGEP